MEMPFNLSEFDLGWLYGFIDGEGCFSINFIKNKKMRTGFAVRPVFMLNQRVEDGEILEWMQLFFKENDIASSTHHDRSEANIGTRYIPKNNLVLIAPGIKNCRKLANLFSTNLFKTKKQKDFEIWIEAIALMENGVHLTETGLIQLASMAEKMNSPKGGRKYTAKYFEDLFVLCY